MQNLELGKLLIVFGIVIIFIGILFMAIDKIPLLGKLPGDIRIQRENFSFYFPITTCVLISAVLSLIFWLFSKR